MKGCSSNAN